MACVSHLLATGARALEPTAEAHDAYNAEVDAENLRMAWGVSSVNSWYKNATGRSAQNWPFSLLDYWRQTRDVDISQYEVFLALRPWRVSSASTRRGGGACRACRWGGGQLVTEVDRPGALVVGQAVAAVGDELGRQGIGRLDPVGRLDDGVDPLPHLLVRDPEHRHVGHRWMHDQGVLRLLGGRCSPRRR